MSGGVNSSDRLAAAQQRIVLALDAPDLATAASLLARVRDSIGAVKIGKELFTAAGPEAVRALHATGLPVFLDLKYHDIPNTVAGAVRAAGRLGVRWMTLHTSGGAAMLEAAAQARDALPEPRPRLLGVTVLTSLGETAADAEEIVDRALLAQRCGLDGAVASPQEVARLRAACGPDFLLVTPGVRPAGAAADDQQRVATPAQAIRDGADLLVIGRPITAAPDPAAAAQALGREIAAALPEGARAARATATVSDRLLAMLQESEALLEGHFLLTSGLHSNRYVQCAKLLQHPQHARRAGIWLADKLRPYRPQAIVSVALGGLVIGQEVAAALGLQALFAERDDSGKLQLRRGFTLAPGTRVVVVDDVCTRGGSIAECAALVRGLGAEVVAAGSIIDRSGGRHTLDVPLEALRVVEARAYPASECPQCAAGQTAIKPGSRKQPVA
jgi:orotidine-5'-phosphate decarboxylase